MSPSLSMLTLFLIYVLFCGIITVAEDTSFEGNTPVIGILTQPRWNRRNNETEYYIAASYVKWLEVAGARAIPIPYDASNALVDEIFTQINGLLLPGGESDVPPAATRLFQLAQQDASDYFPIWGTCLGYEYLIQLVSSSSSSDSSVLQPGFDAENVSLPLLLDHLNESILYSDDRIREIVTTQNVTMHNHHMGVDPEAFQKHPELSNMWFVTASNVDRQGRPFVSTIEPRDPDKFPLYGVQFHPEKNSFEYGTRDKVPVENINHSADAVYFSLYLAQFLGKLLRRSYQQPNSAHSYNKPSRHPLVYEYPMSREIKFEQVFIVPSAEYWEKRNDNEDTDSPTDGHSMLRGSIAV